MPPPPPPSKSYLLVLDTDSEDEEEAEETSYRIRDNSDPSVVLTPNSSIPPESPQDAATPTPTSMETTRMMMMNRRRPHVVEDEEDEDYDDSEGVNTSTEFETEDTTVPSAGETLTPSMFPLEEEEAAGPELVDTSEPKMKKKSSVPPLTKNQKKKLARRRKNKKSKSEESKKKVQFSNVTVVTYPRAFSRDTVPSDGGWPLGMEREPLVLPDGSKEFTCPLELFETEKQQWLKERWERLQKSPKKMDEKVLQHMTACRGGGGGDDKTDDTLLLETRQWDYRRKLKNPLFGPMSEDERQTLFLNLPLSDSSGDNNDAPKGRARSLSVSSDHSNSSCTSQQKRRMRSGSFGATVQFNEKYNQVYVHHVRNELEQLRNERSKSGATGCNCRKLSVYLPPKDGGGGKKAQHRRLKPSKLAQELKKRNLYDASASREAMEQTLHDAVEQEPCCSQEDCFCYRNGIDCQADACSCWHDSHGHSRGASGGSLSPREIAARCGNPLGTTTVDIDAIDTFRNHFLETGYCLPVGQGQ